MFSAGGVPALAEALPGVERERGLIRREGRRLDGEHLEQTVELGRALRPKPGVRDDAGLEEAAGRDGDGVGLGERDEQGVALRLGEERREERRRVGDERGAHGAPGRSAAASSVAHGTPRSS